MHLKENGKFGEIRKKWLDEEEYSWVANDLVTLIFILVGIVILFAIINYLLSFIIKRRTKELEFVNSRLKLISNTKISRIDKFSAKEQTIELLNNVKETFQVESCIVRIIENNELILWGNVGFDKNILQDKISLNMGIAKKIITQKKALAIKNISEEKDIIEENEKSQSKFKFIAYAGAPLFIADKIIGIIGIYSNKNNFIFTKIDLDHLQIVANQLAIAIENSTLFEQNNKQKELLLEQINSRIKIEETLKMSEEKFKLAFHTSPDSVNINRLEDGVYIDINEGFTALTAYTREDVIGKSSKEINIWVVIEDRKKRLSSKYIS